MYCIKRLTYDLRENMRYFFKLQSLGMTNSKHEEVQEFCLTPLPAIAVSLKK